ncbi:MAG: HAD family hydrolase [Methanohalobium sp.]|uniref:HAD family hydrolase n=1 Tax=Methanohalobium sp. TaxID=2837493 RepID=UPI00397A00F8
MEPTENIHGIIFDCYKTLLDTKVKESKSAYKKTSKWLLYQGVDITFKELRDEYLDKIQTHLKWSIYKHPEIRVENIFTEICSEYAIWDIDEKQMGIETAKAFRSFSIKKLTLYKDSLKLLDKFDDIPKCIISNGQRVFSEPELVILGLYGYFNFLIFSSDFGYKKPDTRLFQTAAERMNLKPEYILSIGDKTKNDIHAPQKIGMKTMHIKDAWDKFLNSDS